MAKGIEVTSELEDTAFWLSLRTDALLSLERSLAAEQAAPIPRVDEIRRLQRQLDTLRRWDVLATMRATKGK